MYFIIKANFPQPLYSPGSRYFKAFGSLSLSRTLGSETSHVLRFVAASIIIPRIIQPKTMQTTCSNYQEIGEAR